MNTMSSICFFETVSLVAVRPNDSDVVGVGFMKALPLLVGERVEDGSRGRPSRSAFVAGSR